MSAAPSPLIAPPSQQQQPDRHHHSRSDDQQQPLPSTSITSKRPSTSTSSSTTTAAAAIMRRDNKPAAGPGVIRLEIYADLLCPWCFIEKRSLDALTRRYAEEHPDVRFEVVWKPYYIAPAMAKHNVDKRSIYSRLNTLNPTFLPRIHLAAAKHNISFSIRGLTGNTRPAHRLIAHTLARHGPEAQSRVVEALFRGHFEDGRDLSDEVWLAAVGAQVGGMADLLVDEEEEAGRRVDEVAERARREFGVEAVPCVMVQGRYKVGGYQEGVVFERLFDKIRLGGEVS